MPLARDELSGKTVLIETPTGWLFGTVKITYADGVEKISIDFEDGTESTDYTVEDIQQLLVTGTRQETFYGNRNFWEKLKSKYDRIRNILLRSNANGTKPRNSF